MKKLLFLLAAVGAIFTACQSGPDNEENSGTPSTPKIELSQQSVEVEFESAEYEVTITSPYSWEAAAKNDWIEVITETGIAGTKTLKFSVARNEEKEIREGTIVVKNEDYNLIAELYITQKAFVSTITIEPETLTFAVEGGTQEVAITANFEYTYNENADWLTIEKSEKGISVTAQNNVEVEKRTAEITISNEKYGISKVVKATQGAFMPDEIIIDPESLTFTFEGGTQEIAITANFEYEYSTNVDWLTIEKSEKGLNISATQNTKFEECIAEITISSEKYGISKTISVVQKGVSAEPENVIIYTSSNGKIVTPHSSNVFGANIVSNTYRDGQGIIIFDSPVTSIGGSAFYGCTSLKSVTIPNSVTSIGDYAFYECSSLTSVTISNRVTSIGRSAFYNCSSLTSVTIPNSVTSIGYGAFCYCTSLASVTIPDSVTSIEDYAFRGCSSLTSVTIPDSVTSIGVCAFAYCKSLISVTIPNSVTSIGEDAFAYCSSLTSVTIGNSVTSIGGNAFGYCSSLTSVDITDLSAWCKISFGRSSANPLSCGAKLYLNGSELTDITIPSDITKIKRYAFYNCSSLTSVTIPNSVTSIGGSAFYWCRSLTSVTIPDSVTSIGYEAFYCCTSLTSVYCKPTTPPTGGEYMFDGNASGRKIYVPRNSVSEYYWAEYWSGYASCIEGYDF